jgi:hypothetical protein
MKTSAKKRKYGTKYARLSTETAGGHKSLTHTETNEIRKRETKREKWELHKIHARERESGFCRLCERDDTL